MRGNNFLPIDLGKRQKQILNPNKNNRRVIHYSYNLINNIGSEEDLVKKDISGQQNSTNSLIKTYPSAASQKDAYGRQGLSKRQGILERKLSLPSSTKNATNQQNGLRGCESKNLVENSGSPLSRENKTSLNYASQASTNRNQKSEQRDGEKYSLYRNDRPNRYSDPLYEQRSLPPIPYRSPYYSETSTTNGWSPDILDRPKISQFSKSQSSLLTTGGVARKDGISAAGNKDIMHGKMRKKAVCDSTDDSYYQRQFLRVLNKRF